MPRFLTRETFIALRARRQAHQIASEILNPHLDLDALPCQHCGRDVPIDRRFATHHCPHCGATLRISIKDEAVLPDEPDDPAIPPTAIPKSHHEIIRWGVCIILGLIIGTALVTLAIFLKT